MLDYVTKMINSIVFVTAHKTKVTDFTRLRKLSFATMFLLIMRHSIKSLQIVLLENKFFKQK